MVRCHYADGADIERILQTARIYREQARTLTGMAADEEMVKPGRDVLADVHSMFLGSEAGLQGSRARRASRRAGSPNGGTAPAPTR